MATRGWEKRGAVLGTQLWVLDCGDVESERRGHTGDGRLGGGGSGAGSVLQVLMEEREWVFLRNERESGSHCGVWVGNFWHRGVRGGGAHSVQRFGGWWQLHMVWQNGARRISRYQAQCGQSHM